ncbi:MAG: GtrA family protein [bacterium]
MAAVVRHLVRFAQVGGVAFALDAGLLWLLVYPLEVPPILARACSFLVTIAVTFVLNARYTFAASVKDASKSRYVFIQCAGAAINFTMYSGLVLAGVLGPLWALVVGSFLGSSHNFLMMRRFVFADATDKPPA